MPAVGRCSRSAFLCGVAESANWLENDFNLLDFHRGGSLDAQAQGGSPDANYVFGVYMNAAGYSLSQTLGAANAYGAGFSNYRPNPNKPRLAAQRRLSDATSPCRD
jgi:hypothetical protein